jgi:RNA ligase
LQDSFTPTFEVTSPKFPIVLLYDKDELTLLHIRENVSGRYLTEAEILALNPPFPMVENLKNQFIGGGVPANFVSWEKIKALAETATGIEGWVIQFKNGDMVKWKTSWYISLHHSVTFTRWRDIARTVIADGADDLKAAFAMTGRSVEPILEVEHVIQGKIKAAQNAVTAHVENGLGLNRTTKDMALAFKGHALFGQVMRAFRGQEVNYLEWYEKNHLDADWSLEVVEANDIAIARTTFVQ